MIEIVAAVLFFGTLAVFAIKDKRAARLRAERHRAEHERWKAAHR